MVPFSRSFDVLPVMLLQKRYFQKTAITPSFFKLETSSKTKMILEVISNDPIHKNDTFLKNIREKRISNRYPWLQKCCMSISQ